MNGHEQQHNEDIDGRVIDLVPRLTEPRTTLWELERETRNERFDDQEPPKRPRFWEDSPLVEVIHPALDFARGTLFTAVPGMNPEVRGNTPAWIVSSQRELFQMVHMEMFSRNLHPKVCCGTLTVMPRYRGAVVKAYSERLLDGDLLETYHRVKNLLLASIDLMDDETYSFLTTWIIGTYLFPVFNVFPYIHFNGSKGVGKTTSLEVLAELCFNGLLTPGITSAAQFRLISACRPTLLIDETENLLRKTSDLNRTIFLHGYAKGGAVYRAERVGKTWAQVAFEVYCPRAFASQQGFEDTLSSRTVRIPMVRTRRMRPRLGREEVQSIREGCFLTSLTCASMVHEIYQSLDDPRGVLPMFGRDYELFQAPLAIATATGDPTIVGEVTAFALKSYRRQQAEFYESSPEHAFLDFLLEYVRHDGEYPGEVLLKTFKQFMLDNGVSFAREWTLQLQGTMLTNLGLVDKGEKKRALRNRARIYFLSRKKLEEVARNYNLT